MHNIAIIPARGGSQRIQKKNIKLFLDKPIIAYSIENAFKSGIFDEIMVSTDDPEIAKIALEYGAKVPFFRSKKNSDNFATTSDVLIEVLKKYEKNGVNFINACCIYATSPLLSEKKILEAEELLIKNDLDCVFPIVQTNFPVERSLKITPSHLVSMNYPEHINTRSQDLVSSYFDAGQFYFFNVSEFLKNKKLWTSKTGSIIIKRIEAQDIDDETDWALAELKYKYLKENNLI